MSYKSITESEQPEESQVTVKYETEELEEADPLATEPVWIKQEIEEKDEEENVNDDEYKDSQASHDSCYQEFKLETIETLGAGYQTGDDWNKEHQVESLLVEPDIQHESFFGEEESDIADSGKQDTVHAHQCCRSTKGSKVKRMSSSYTDDAYFNSEDSVTHVALGGPNNSSWAVSVKSSNSYSCNQLTQTGDDYKCKLCPYNCSDAGDLKRHLALKTHTHTQDKSYKCDLCPYATRRFGNLKRHQTTHSGENCYKCNACLYSSSRPDVLKRHMATHSADKPFKCPSCPYSSRRLGHLRAHLAMHTGDLPYKCTLCSYTSNQSCNLKSHMGTHGSKPFGCDYCDYKSATKRTLSKHVVTRHGGEQL